MNEDENPRQLSLELWGKIYQKYSVQSEEEWVEYIVENGYSTMDELDLEAQFKAGFVALRGTELPWKKLRQLVWKRDKCICQVCLREISYSNYQCGHMVDFGCGGSDRLSNLVVMCGVCNQTKPLTPTKKDYWNWVNQIRQDLYS